MAKTVPIPTVFLESSSFLCVIRKREKFSNRITGFFFENSEVLHY